MSMDWFTWLSKTGLEPTLVYEYGLAFAQNELEEEDVAYFSHEFLQSMGISIAKHRLEILKLARKEKKSGVRKLYRPVSRFLVAVKRTRACVSNYVRTLVRREDSDKALVVVPQPQPTRTVHHGRRWRGAMAKKTSNRVAVAKQETLLLTNGSSERFASPKVHDLNHHDNNYWSAGVEEIRWDTMFQNLKPT